VTISSLIMPNCSFIFLTTVIDIESQSMCDYVNYHLFMFFVCSTLSGLSMLPAMLIIARHGLSPPDEQAMQIRACAKWALIFICHASGFEGALVVLYVCFVSMLLIYVLVFCFTFTWRAVFLVFGGEKVRVFPVVEMVTEPFPIQVVVVGDCSICLEPFGESGSAARQWFTTQCGHTFHVGCLAKWRQRTCPLCRAAVVMPVAMSRENCG